jgi:hypothetical protein
MRCLYCGKQLALFRRLTGGGEFCSDSHKASYHDEFNRLALARLKQAQEKSDELRAAAPQNQLALIRRVPGEPEAPSIRSNAHWIEPKPSRPLLRKPLALPAPAAPPEPPAPKQAEFIKDMPQPVQPDLSAPDAAHLQPRPAATAKSLPVWDPPVAPIEERDLELGAFLPGTSLPEPVQSAPAPIGSADLNAVPVTIESVKPAWNPPPAQAQIQLPGGEQMQGVQAPLPYAPIFENDTTSPSAVYPVPAVTIPAVVTPAPVLAVYPSQPAVEIDPLRFAPGFEVQVETRSQGLPFRFDFTAFIAPDFDVLEPGETPPPQMKLKKRQMLKRTEQEHALDPPVETIRRKAAASAQAFDMGTIGEIAALVIPVKSLQPKLAKPAERRLDENPFVPNPPATVLPRSAVLPFRPEERAKPATAADDLDDKRPSALKVKLAAMATLPPPPPTPEPPKPDLRPSVTPVRQPAERSTTAQPPPLFTVPPRRRTVQLPSIIDPPLENGDEQKSLWGALRRYLGK